MLTVLKNIYPKKTQNKKEFYVQANAKIKSGTFKKYCPKEAESAVKAEINKDFKRLCIVEIEIDHMTGKKAVDFVRKANKKPVA